MEWGEKSHMLKGKGWGFGPIQDKRRRIQYKRMGQGSSLSIFFLGIFARKKKKSLSPSLFCSPFSFLLLAGLARDFHLHLLFPPFPSNLNFCSSVEKGAWPAQRLYNFQEPKITFSHSSLIPIPLAHNRKFVSDPIDWQISCPTKREGETKVPGVIRKRKRSRKKRKRDFPPQSRGAFLPYVDGNGAVSARRHTHGKRKERKGCPGRVLPNCSSPQKKNKRTLFSSYIIITHPVLLADSAGVLEVPCPCEAERAALEVAVREHVGQAEGVVVLLWKI